tara:strand:+ start:12200 stop:13066 length:867 start_codon:yes stop_codon:yes gene_type:complete
MEKVVINIGGCIRSGTTLLNLILGNQSNVLALGEIKAFFYPNRKQHLFDRKNLIASDDRWQKIYDGGLENFYDNLFQYFKEYDVFIDSSKDPLWYSRMEAANPEVSFKSVLIYKHPKDMVRSLQKRGVSNYKKLVKNYYSDYFQIYQGTFFVISLYELLQDDSVLKALCEYTGLEYREDRRCYWLNKNSVNFHGSDTARSNTKLLPEGTPFSQEDLKSLRDSDLKGWYRLYKTLSSNRIIDNQKLDGLQILNRFLCIAQKELSERVFKLRLWIRDYIMDRKWIKAYER